MRSPRTDWSSRDFPRSSTPLQICNFESVTRYKYTNHVAIAVAVSLATMMVTLWVVILRWPQ
jgi:hypothetical protein